MRLCHSLGGGDVHPLTPAGGGNWLGSPHLPSVAPRGVSGVEPRYQQTQQIDYQLVDMQLVDYQRIVGGG